MIWIVVALYLWAGMTTAHVLWQIEEINESVKTLMKTTGIDAPRSKRIMSSSPSVCILIIVIWPVVLPIWVWQWRRHNAALSGDSGFIAGVQLESTVMQKVEK